MSWSHGMRQWHRWVSIAFTAGVTFNFVAVATGHYANWMGLLAGVPLAALFVTGLYLFALPYLAKRRGARP